MEPSGHGQLYDLETFPTTCEEGSMEVPLVCLNGCFIKPDGEVEEHLRELKVLQKSDPLISVVQCRACRKRWLRVEYDGRAQKAD
jgi:hypothetical protein